MATIFGQLSNWQQIAVALGVLCGAVSALATAAARVVDLVGALVGWAGASNLSACLHILGVDSAKANDMIAKLGARRAATPKPNGFVRLDAIVMLAFVAGALFACTPAQTAADANALGCLIPKVQASIQAGASPEAAIVQGATACAMSEIQAIELLNGVQTGVLTPTLAARQRVIHLDAAGE
jgi:hypothetical protein